MSPRIGARVLLLDAHDRVLMMHAMDPDLPSSRWWELPGGGMEEGEYLEQTARRELAEETGIQLARVGRILWVSDDRFNYRGRSRYHRNHVYLARLSDTTATVPLKPSANETIGMLGRRWLTVAELCDCGDYLMPRQLPELLESVLAGTFPARTLFLGLGSYS